MLRPVKDNSHLPEERVLCDQHHPCEDGELHARDLERGRVPDGREYLPLGTVCWPGEERLKVVQCFLEASALFAQPD